ncbi:MAG: aspartate aminotransferase family protein [bacterium]|nr:aspartate aminotransferase family protein [bacterium]
MVGFETLSFPDAPQIRTSPPGPESKRHLEAQSLRESSAVSYPRGMPMALRRAAGATVEDVDGNVYIDFFGGAGVMNVGHANPDVLAAARAQLGDLTHTLDIPSPVRTAMVKRLAQVLPDELNKMLFGGPTGSDAVEAAVKLVKYNTKRYPMIAFEGGYHGMTAGALSLCSGQAFKGDFLPLLPEVHFAPYAYCYRCPFKREAATCDLECGAYLEHLIEDSHSGVGRPAGILVEAIQGEGGSIVPDKRFMPKVREICDRFEIPLIVDEIQAGFCRTGKMFAFQHTKIVPDIVTLSKALGGVGFPISAIAYRENLDTMPPGKHIGTFRGNLIAYAGGAAGISFMLEHDLAGHATRIGDQMLVQLGELERDSAMVGEVRGKGLMLGVEFVKDRTSKVAAPEFATKVRNLCHKRGVLIEVGGHYFNVARFLPPLVVTEDLAQKGAEIFMDTVRELEKTA